MDLHIINHSSIADELINRAVTDSINYYHTMYEKPSCGVDIILCKDKHEFHGLMLQHTGEDERVLSTIRDYNGNFLCPIERSDTFRIILMPSDLMVPGAERYYYEAENGSQRTSSLPQTERETRGVEIGNFCHFIETLLHEYSHLCSYDKLMSATGWEDPKISIHSMDYHLYDEFIARYKGIYVMLRMMSTYIEVDLLFTLWMDFWEDTLKAFKEESKVLEDYLISQKDAIESDILALMKDNHLNASDMVAELENELGHGLHHKGKLAKSGAPLLSPAEVAEFLMFDDFSKDEAELAELNYKRNMPVFYFTKNSYASYQGSQIIGIVQSFHDFLLDETDEPDEELRTMADSLDLCSVMDTPYYKQINVEKMKVRLERLTDLFQVLQKREQDELKK